MTILRNVGKKIQTILGTKADALGETTGFIKRKRKFTGSTFIKTLVFGWMQTPQATLEELVQAGVLNDIEISAQGLDKRFTPKSADLARAVLEQAVAEAVRAPNAVPIELLNRFSSVTLFDTTILNLPDELYQVWAGTGGNGPTSRSALKGEIGYDLKTGQLIGPLLLPGKTHDNAGKLPQMELEECSLQIADLGYFSIAKMAENFDANVFCLSRLRHDAVLFDEQEEEFDLSLYTLFMKKNNRLRAELNVLLVRYEKLPVRLFIERVPEMISSKRRRQANKGASKKKKGKTASKKSLSLCDFTLLVTTAPSVQLSFDEALVLYGARWQIELLFKLWKSHAKLDTSIRPNPWRICRYIYIKLLACLVQHWIILMGCWNHPSLRLVKAAQVIRNNANLIAVSFISKSKMLEAFGIIMRCFAHCCKQNSRRKHPNTWKTLIEGKPKWA
ncbi:IS231-related transposase [Beggiatoa sp. PS]|nr:IS231-related transposase [Beggiatoa sp. PS]